MNSTAPSSSHLSWGIKDSFRSYLSRLADFSLNVEDGASVGAGNAVCFPLTAVSTGDAVWSGLGHAIFRAHGGMMRLSLKNPVVRESGKELLLTFDFGSVPGTDGSDYFEVARLEEISDKDSAGRTFRTFLLPGATGLFNDMYDQDTEMDPVTIALGTDC